jgi:hypothetical protein
MNIQDFKFIIASGCSYATTLSSLENKTLNVKLDTSDNLIFIEVGCASQCSDWAYDSVIYAVNKLFEIGIKSENIYCFVEWTQIERITITQPTILHEFFNTHTWKEKLDRHFYIKSNVENSNNIIDSLYDVMNIKMLQDVHNIMSIENLWYINPTHTDKNDILRFDNVDLEMTYKEMLEYELRIPIETRVKTYLNNIINLQTYLKNNQISYNFASMQSQFSGWDIDSNYIHVHKYTLNHNRPAYSHNNKLKINNRFKETLNINSADDLIEVFPQFKYLINQIDFTNWWFHQSDFYRYGGIDEYALEMYGLYGYLTTDYEIRTPLPQIDITHVIPSFGYHPNAFIHVLLVNEMMFNNKFFKVSNETIDNIKNMVDDDINTKNRTKHNLAISKTEIEKYIELI